MTAGLAVLLVASGPVVLIGEPKRLPGVPDGLAMLDGGLSSGSVGPDPIPWRESPVIPVTKGASSASPPAEPVFPETASWQVDLGAAETPAAAQAGDLPVVVSPRRGTTGAGGSFEVEVLDRGAAKRAGVSGVVFTVADRGTRAALPAELSVDYSGFANAGSDDFAARLTVVALPDCVVADPLPKGCNTAGVNIQPWRERDVLPWRLLCWTWLRTMRD